MASTVSFRKARLPTRSERQIIGDVQALLTRGESPETIAEEIGISEQDVADIVARHGAGELDTIRAERLRCFHRAITGLCDAFFLGPRDDALRWKYIELLRGIVQELEDAMNEPDDA